MTLRHTVYGAVWAVHLAVVFGLVSTAFWTLNPVIVFPCLIAGILASIFGSLFLLDAAPESKASRRRNMEWAREADDRAAIGKTQELKRLAHENGLPWWDGEKIVWPEVKWPEEEKKSLSVDAFGAKNVKTITEVYGDSPVIMGWSNGIPVRVEKGACGHYPECEYNEVSTYDEHFVMRRFTCGKQGLFNSKRLKTYYSKMDDGEFC